MPFETIAFIPAGLVAVWAVLAVILSVVIHIAFSIAVFQDASNLPGSTVLVSPGVWALSTLLFGLLAATVYWAMHHSSLRSSTGLPDIQRIG